VSEGGF